jgi:hypothetical protein
MSHAQFPPAYPQVCLVCRMAMIGGRSKPESREFDIYRCLQCDLTITTVPANHRQAADQT